MTHKLFDKLTLIVALAIFSAFIGAPVLSQVGSGGVSPAPNTHSGDVTIDGNLSLDYVGTNDARSINLHSTGASHWLSFLDTDATADTTRWLLGRTGTNFQLLSRDDADTSTTVTAISAAHDGSEVELNGTLLDFNGAAELSGGLTMGGNFTLSHATQPLVSLREADGSANEKNWLALTSNGDLFLSTALDASPTTIANTAMRVYRTGATVDEVEFNGTLLDFNGDIASDGHNTFTATPTAPSSYPLQIVNASPFWSIDESDAAANTGVWDFGAVGGQLRGRAIDDAGSGSNWLEVERSGGTPVTTKLYGYQAVAITNCGSTSTIANQIGVQTWTVSDDDQAGECIVDFGSMTLASPTDAICTCTHQQQTAANGITDQACYVENQTTTGVLLQVFDTSGATGASTDVNLICMYEDT